MTTPTTPPALIAVDIDGTLLTSDGIILPGTRAEFARARAQGATIILASGRPVAGLRRLVQRLALDTTGMVFTGANGAVGVDATTGEVLFRHSLPGEIVRDMCRFAKEHGILVMLCDGDDLVVDSDDPMTQIEVDGNGLTRRDVPHLADLRDDEVQVDKLLMHAQPETLRPFAELFTAKFGEQVECSFSAPFYFEATALGIDKGSALMDLAEVRGVDATDSVAFGDNGNDLPMLRVAGYSVAMGNAIPEVLSTCDRVTASHDDNGIALVLADLYGAGHPAPPVPEPDIEPLHALNLRDDGA